MSRRSSMAHPVLTTIMVVFALGITHDIIVNVATVIDRRKGSGKGTE